MTPRGNAQSTGTAFAAVTTLFFAWGFVTSNNDPLIAALKTIYRLTTAEATLTQFAFFLAYAVASIPAAMLLARIGASRTILASLALMIAACVVVIVASNFQTYLLILVALFLLAAGITALQVAANPLAAALGAPGQSHFRLLFAQSFNSLGVVFGVQVGSSLMLSGAIFQKGAAAVTTAAARAEGLASVDRAFAIIAVFLAALMLLIWVARRRIEAAAPPPAEIESPLAAFTSRWAVFGAAAIFLYVGAEVAIGSVMIIFLERSDVLNLSKVDAGWYLGWIYWFGALVGRFIGSWLLTRFAATRLLGIAAVAAAGLSLAVVVLPGAAGAYAALSIGLFNSIMFPTIFSLTLERSSASVPATSGLLCVAIVGGAALPYIVGKIADAQSIPASFIVPALAYVAVVAFAVAASRARVIGVGAASMAVH